MGEYPAVSVTDTTKYRLKGQADWLVSINRHETHDPIGRA